MTQYKEPRFTKIRNAFRLYKYKLYWFIFFSLILVLFVFFKYDFLDLCLQAVLAVTSTLLILLIIDSVKQEVEEEEHDNYIKDIIWDALRMENRVLKLYNKESIEQVMQNCIGHFCPHLAESYVDYIQNNLNLFRKDFSYHVAIKKNKEDLNSILISHIISYTRFFKIADVNSDVRLRCYFTIKAGELDNTMRNNSLFFREELLYLPLLEKINKVQNDKDLIKLLGVKFCIGEDNVCIKDDDIDVVRNEYGIEFSAKIDRCYLCENEVDYGENYISYHAKVECRYSAKLDNRFYCIFSNPTIGTTNFSITFFDDIIEDVNSVDKITMLSNTNYSISTIADLNKIEFKTSQAIFPRSGILIQWDAKK